MKLYSYCRYLLYRGRNLTYTEVKSVCSHGSIYLQQARTESWKDTMSHITLEHERRDNKVSANIKFRKLSDIEDIDIRKQVS